ncbi:hypothetical protein D3C80_1453260 [compost metagenome]
MFHVALGQLYSLGGELLTGDFPAGIDVPGAANEAEDVIDVGLTLRLSYHPQMINLVGIEPLFERRRAGDEHSPPQHLPQIIAQLWSHHGS